MDAGQPAPIVDEPSAAAGARRPVWSLILPSLGLLVALAAWLWPIGFGARMAVGGDSTRFAPGLMAFYAEALRARTLPAWNPLWGFGFPGLAESQMGPYYPPHLLLYACLGPESAATWSLVLHTGWCGLGAAWAARQFGCRVGSSVVAGGLWAMSGFFLIHLAHPWASTAGSWMPWIWGLAWNLGIREHLPRRACLLASALAIQVLPGHFQLAFITQIGLIGLLVVRRLAPRRGEAPEHPGSGRAATALALVLAIAGAGLLATAQLAPTARLASETADDRDWEYLGTFANTPIHLVNYVAPGLFHHSPLWRSVIWDPFRAIPEESLGYVGVIGLFLACRAMGRSIRRDRAVLALTVVAAGMLVLSLGPHIPGFRLLAALPGFSFFRAPARYGVGADLALAILAGRGLDLAADAATGLLGSATRFLLIGLAWIAAICLLVEGGLWAAGAGGPPAVARMYESALAALPWRGPPTLDGLGEAARAPQGGLRERSALAREGVGRVPAEGLSFARERWAIYRRELAHTTTWGGALLVVAVLSRWLGRREWRVTAFGLLAWLDLITLQGLRRVELAPLAPLRAQSPVLARLAELPRGSRSIDEAGNLVMTVGLAPVGAYRTLDLPRPGRLVEQARGPLDSARTLAALRGVGARVRLLSPFELADLDARGGNAASVERVQDPALASWLYGGPWIAGEGHRFTEFGVYRAPGEPALAWLVPGSGPEFPVGEDPDALLEILGRAMPLGLSWKSPEECVVAVPGEAAGRVLLAIQADRPWVATWAGTGEPAPIAGAAGGWMSVAKPPGIAGALNLRYDRTVIDGSLRVSAVAWALWGLIFVYALRGPRARGGRST